jgi:multiple antibiotic resistance protein
MSFSVGGIIELAVTITVFAILCVITYVIFVFGKKFVTFIGTSALGAITRMMGLILAVIGVQMVIDGLNAAFRFT